MSNYYKRQLNLTLKTIQSFENKTRSLHSLINDLESLLTLIGEINPFLEKNARGHCGSLEEVYAYALYKEKTSFDEQDEKIIFDAISTLQNFSNFEGVTAA